MISINTKKKVNRNNSFFISQGSLKLDNLDQSEDLLSIETDKREREEINELIKNIIAMNLSETKERMHKEFIKFQHHIKDSVQSYSQQIKNITAYEKRLIEQYTDMKIKTDKIEIISEKISKIEEKFTTNEIRFNNLSKDFHNAVNKYDDIYLNNLIVPGKIGNYCKYKNIKDFILYVFNKFNEYDLKKENDLLKMKLNQEKQEKFINKISCEINSLRNETMKMNANRKIYFEEKLAEEINKIIV
jgi:hypothetical protein